MSQHRRSSTGAGSSSSSSEKERVKKWHPKTRNGCVTCKSRRVKCDQGRPSCDNCLHIGKQCVYNVPQPIVFESRKHSAKPAPTLAISTRLFRGDTYASNVQQFGYEWLVNFCRGMETYERFWTYHFPQICHYEEPLEHMELSLAARYKSAFHPPSAADHLALAELATKHHAEAMRKLTIPGKKPSREVMLIGCLFFMTFDTTKDAMSNGFVHLKASQNILREWKRDRLKAGYSETKSATDLIELIIQPILSRVEPLVNPVLAARALSNSMSRMPLLPTPQMPNMFNTISAAVGTLRNIANWIRAEAAPRLMFLQYPYTELDETVHLCTTWQRLFEVYKDTFQTDSEVPHFLANALEAYHQVLQVLVKQTALPNEMVWGLYSDELGVALRQCRALVLEPLSDIALYKDMIPRLAAALFATGLLSRRLFLQRQAVQLLRDIHASCHGPEDDCFMATLIEANIEMINKNKPNNEIALLPMSGRVRILKAELIPKSSIAPGKIIITYTRPIVRPIIRTQVTELRWNSEVAPPCKDIWLWPPIELLRFAGPTGLLGSTNGKCACRLYGGRPEDLNKIHTNMINSSAFLQELQSQSRRKSEGTVFDLAIRPSSDMGSEGE